MTGETPSGWVPDKLPEFKNRTLPIVINDQRIALETIRLSEHFNRTSTEISQNFLRLGLVIAAYEDQDKGRLFEEDANGNRTLITLAEQEYTEPPYLLAPDETLGENSTVSLPSLLIDEVMGVANRRETTVDDAIRKMFILGLKMLRAEVIPGTKYILERGETSQELHII